MERYFTGHILAYTLEACMLEYMLSSKTQTVCIWGIFIANSQVTDKWLVACECFVSTALAVFEKEEEAASSPPLILCLPLQLSLCICPT